MGAAEKREGKRQKERDAKRASGTGNLFRFRMKQGTTKEIVFLDESLTDGISFYEHNLQGDDGRWGNHVVCAKDLGEGACPVCEAKSPSYFVYLYSVVVPDAYTDKRTGEEKDSRMILPIKYTQWGDIKKILMAACKANGGKLRGVSLTMHRNTGPATQAPNIGTPQIDEDSGQMFTIYTEEELVEYYGHKAIKSDDGKVLKEKNANITPIPFMEVVKEPDMDELRATYGGGGVEGSQEDTEDEWDGDDEDEEDEDDVEDFDDDEEDEDEDEDEDDDEDEDEEDDDWGDEDDED